MTRAGDPGTRGRGRALPRPAVEALLVLPLHVVVRDYPETLAVLSERGVETRAAGARSLSRLLAEREDGEAILGALLAAMDWRTQA